MLNARSAKYRLALFDRICLKRAGRNSSQLFITFRDRAGLGEGRFKFTIEAAVRGVSQEAVCIALPLTRSDYAVESISIASIPVRLLQILSRDSRIDFEINSSDSSSSSSQPPLSLCSLKWRTVVI